MSDDLTPSVKLYVEENTRYKVISGKIYRYFNLIDCLSIVILNIKITRKFNIRHAIEKMSIIIAIN